LRSISVRAVAASVAPCCGIRGNAANSCRAKLVSGRCSPIHRLTLILPLATPPPAPLRVAPREVLLVLTVPATMGFFALPIYAFFIMP
jgi:hypothetical protein